MKQQCALINHVLHAVRLCLNTDSTNVYILLIAGNNNKTFALERRSQRLRTDQNKQTFGTHHANATRAILY